MSAIQVPKKQIKPLYGENHLFGKNICGKWLYVYGSESIQKTKRLISMKKWKMFVNNQF